MDDYQRLALVNFLYKLKKSLIPVPPKYCNMHKVCAVGVDLPVSIIDISVTERGGWQLKAPNAQ